MKYSQKLVDDIYYYDGENNVYDNRHDLLLSTRSKTKLFYYYDDKFDKVEWTKEPIEDLQTLYTRRAQQIRDQYEYVILCWSGGVDSTTILETFYYNKIHIDEILLVGAFSQDSARGDDSNHNGDIYHNVWPTLKTLDLPNTKITVKDYSLNFDNPNNFSLIKDYSDDYMKFLGPMISVHNLFWYDLKKFVLPNNEKKACYIMGSDKPRLNIDSFKNSFFTEFNDASVTDYGANFKDENLERVNFYAHPDAEAIIRKQLHILLKFYIKNVQIEKNMTHDDFQKHYITIVNTLMYDLKNPLRHKSKKSVIACISERDNFIVNKQDSEIYKLFRNNLLKIDKRIAYKRQAFQTKRYYITERLSTP